MGTSRARLHAQADDATQVHIDDAAVLRRRRREAAARIIHEAMQGKLDTFTDSSDN